MAFIAWFQWQVAFIHYNLRCYESQLGDLAAAKQHLKRAVELEPKCSGTALDDPDFAPWWETVGSE